MPPKIYDPADLTPEDKLLIERQGFQPLPDALQKEYRKVQKKLDKLWIEARADPAYESDWSDKEYKTENDNTPELDRAAVNKNGYRLSWREMSTVVSSEDERSMRLAVRYGPMDAYLGMICDYVNRVRGEALNESLHKDEDTEMGGMKGVSEAGTSAEAPDENKSTAKGKGKRKRSISLENQMGKPFEISSFGPSCARIPGRDFTVLREAVVRLNERGREERNTKQLKSRTVRACLENCMSMQVDFANLDYLFIPVVIRTDGHPLDGAHSVLFGMAPKQRFLFGINTIGKRFSYDDNDCILKSIHALLLSQIPVEGFAEDNTDVQLGEWRIYGSWPNRESATKDDSPDAPQQGDHYNCGIFACTNAFCLAFGYDLLCWEQRRSIGKAALAAYPEDAHRPHDLDDFKKPRMWAELTNGGFDGDYEYDLLTIPEIVGRSGARPSATGGTRQRAGRQGEGDPAEKKRKTEEEPSRREPIGKMSRLTVVGSYVDDDSDQGVVAPSDSDTEDSGVSGLDGEESGSDGESDSEATLTARGITRQKLYTTADLQSTLSFTPSPTDIRFKDALPFPRQFDLKEHREAVLVYTAPSFFNVQNRQYSKRELKEVCREFKLRNWRWSHMDQELFLKWVLSEVGAVVARKRGHFIGPVDGMGWTTDDIKEKPKGSRAR